MYDSNLMPGAKYLELICCGNGGGEDWYGKGFGEECFGGFRLDDHLATNEPEGYGNGDPFSCVAREEGCGCGSDPFGAGESDCTGGEPLPYEVKCGR